MLKWNAHSNSVQTKHIPNEQQVPKLWLPVQLRFRECPEAFMSCGTQSRQQVLYDSCERSHTCLLLQPLLYAYIQTAGDSKRETHKSPTFHPRKTPGVPLKAKSDCLLFLSLIKVQHRDLVLQQAWPFTKPRRSWSKGTSTTYLSLWSGEELPISHSIGYSVWYQSYLCSGNSAGLIWKSPLTTISCASTMLVTPLAVSMRSSIDTGRGGLAATSIKLCQTVIHKSLLILLDLFHLLDSTEG